MGSHDGGAGPRRFRMRERFFDLGEDFTVEDEAERPAFRVDGKVLTLRKTFVLEDPGGGPLVTIREPLISLRDTVVIDRPGRPAAIVKRALLSLLRPRFNVELADGDLEVVGDIIGHEYTIRGDRGTVARISLVVRAPRLLRRGGRGGRGRGPDDLDRGRARGLRPG